MNIEKNVSLKKYSSMNLGGNAKYLVEIFSDDDLLSALKFAENEKLDIKVVGTGSNLVWKDEGYSGLVIVNRIDYIDFINEDMVKIGSGTIWDEAIKNTVDRNLSGIEFLSLIPGTAGATPVQNVGAYGREIKDCLVDVKAYDLKVSDFVIISNEECDFSYRKSRFNSYDKNRFIITEITLKLSKNPPSPPFYESLQNYLNNNNISKYTPQTLRQAVIAVRTTKLPDPDIVANNGSYFANPIITPGEFTKLSVQYSDIPHWEHNGNIKISAAWLIEKAGFKDYHDKSTGMATWNKQPLVLINENAEKTEDLITFRDKIVGEVDNKFNIKLVQEPEIV